MKKEELINVDSFIKSDINKPVGQDYILSGDSPFPYIIIADGCSSSKQVDVGARILAHTAASNINYIVDQFDLAENNYEDNSIMSIGYSIIQMASVATQSLHLHETALDSTLVISWIRNNCLNAVMYGDGNFICNFGDDRTEIVNINYKDNQGFSTPFYLSYYLNKSREHAWHERKVIQITQTHIIKPGVEIAINYSADNVLSERKCVFLSLSLDCSLDFTDEFDLSPIKNFLITSDGVEQIMHKRNRDRIHLIEVSQELLKLKNFRGSFIKRRCNTAFTDWAKKDYNNEDDVSVGAFHIRRV